MTSDVNQSNTLRRRVLSGGAWTIFGYGLGQSIRLVSNLTMARLLLPEAFGLMAIAITIYVGLGMTADFGITASIVRSKSATDRKFLATAWSLQVGRDLLIALLMAIAGLVLWIMQQAGSVKFDSVFADPRLCIIIWATCASVIVGAFKSVRAPLAQRRMDIKRIIRLEILAQLFALFIMIAAAYAGAGVYSLAVGQFASALFMLFGSYVLFDGPKSEFGFHREHFSEIFNYGKWLLAASLLGFIVARGDQFIFGYIFEKNDFSLYAVATIWIMALVALMENLQLRIVYPAYSELHRENPEGLTNAYRKFRILISGGLFLVFLVLFFGSEYIFNLLYPGKYTGVAKYVGLLSFSLLMMPYNLLNSALLSSGDSKNFTMVILAPVVALFAFTPMIYDNFGAEAAIIFFACIRVFSLPFAWWHTSKLIRLNPLMEALPLAVIALFAFYALS